MIRHWHVISWALVVLMLAAAVAEWTPPLYGLSPWNWVLLGVQIAAAVLYVVGDIRHRRAHRAKAAAS